MRVAYIRVSTEEQNSARQRDALEAYGIEKWYEEKVSGKNMEREQLQQMIDFVREGDEVYVMDFSRLSRSVQDLLNIVEGFNKKNVKLVSLKENLDTSTPTGKLMLTMLGAIAEFERANILERQREGIAIAKREGKYKGRKEKKLDNFEEAIKYYNLAIEMNENYELAYEGRNQSMLEKHLQILDMQDSLIKRNMFK